MANTHKILVIDDVFENIVLAEQILLNNGYSVHTANNGELGFEIAENIIPDLILLDIVMPNVSGFDVLKRLKNNCKTRNIPVILLSALDDIDNCVKGIELLAADYITKPFVELDLISRIKRNIELANNINKGLQSEELYSQLFELLTDSILLIDNKTGNILMANNQASILYGYTIDELTNLKNTDLAFDQDDARKLNEKKQTKEDRVINIPLQWHKKKDGTIFPVEIAARFFELNNNKVHISEIREISKKYYNDKLKNIQIKILEHINSEFVNENYLYEFLKIIKEELNFDSVAIKYKLQNSDYTEFACIGYSENYEIDHSIVNVNQDDCAVKHSCICGYLFNKNKVKLFSKFGSFFTNNLPVFVNKKSQETKSIEFNNDCVNAGYKSLALIPIYNRDIKIGILQINNYFENSFNEHIVSLLEEVSGSITMSMLQKEYLDKIKISEKKYKELVENINEIIITFSSDSKILFVSNSVYQLLGYSANELYGKSLKEIVYEADIEIFESSLKSVLDKTISKFEIRFINQFGKPLWCIFSSSNFSETNSNEISGVISNIEDRKQKEFEINYLNSELEQIVYVTSHDLRSPLVNIHGFSTEIKKVISRLKERVDKEIEIGKIKESVNKDIETINEFYNYIFPSITKINTLIDGLLSLSRVGRVDVRSEFVDMNNLFHNILTVMEYRIKSSGIKIILSKVADCRSDEKLLNQLFSNLIDNAIKYRSTKVESFIKIYSKETAKAITYFIEDNGIGISKSELSKIFTLFYRSTNASSGDGIGLAIVKKIIKKLNGSINIDSELDIGSCFKVTLNK